MAINDIDTTTLINVFDVDASDQQQLVDTLVEGIDDVISARPGFLSATVLASNDGTRVVNYARWRALDDVKATFGDPGARAATERAAAIAAGTPHVFTVAYER